MSRVTRPKLVPPCYAWREDLPGPDELPVLVPTLGYDTPNHQDDVFLELQRSFLLVRGLLIWFVPFVGIMEASFLWMTLSDGRLPDVEEAIMTILRVLLSVGLIVCCIRLDVDPPRDLPLRFNRARQRLYAYNFKTNVWNPLERGRVVPVAYEWSQVRAERWQGGGGRCGVELSIVKPGTNEVIDRFSLTFIGADAYAWAYVCTYMQQGPDALPPPGPPKDHNDVSWLNIALLLAPKVKWPADMDRESRTAP